MIDLIVHILAVIAPVFLIPGVAYIWVKRGKAFDTQFIGELVLYLSTPALIFSGLTRVSMSGSDMMLMGVACLILSVCILITGFVALWVVRLPVRTYLTGLIMPNTGNMGIPICYFAFGPEGLTLSVIGMVVLSILTIYVGLLITGGRRGLGDLIRLPNIYAIFIACGFLGTETPVPLWLANFTQVLGDMTIPLMLLMLGVGIARMQVARIGATLYVTVLRLGLGPVLGWGIGAALGLPPMVHAILILQAGMPVAVYAFVVAERYGGHPEDMASLILVTTVVSVVSIPFLLFFLLPV